MRNEHAERQKVNSSKETETAFEINDKICVSTCYRLECQFACEKLSSEWAMVIVLS